MTGSPDDTQSRPGWPPMGSRSWIKDSGCQGRRTYRIPEVTANLFSAAAPCGLLILTWFGVRSRLR